jgi:DNA-binding transcriptional LysR family regulator
MGFRVAFVPGVTPTKWLRVWAERKPRIRIEPLPVDETDQVAVLREDRADVCFVRLPIDRDGLHAIPLYAEAPVVVVAKDDELTLLDEVDIADLPAGDLLHPGPVGVGDAVELVAAGGGMLVLPKSVARLHNRRDVVAVPLTGVPETRIALAWPIENPNALVDDFIGIVRGRTANSSRG